MRLINLAGRAAISLANGSAIDIAAASDGRFGPAPRDIFRQWGEFRSWAKQVSSVDDLSEDAVVTIVNPDLGAPSPDPQQIFAVGLNYRSHAAEAGLAVPQLPMVFTKFPSSITGPFGEIAIPGDGFVDFEVELVVVIGKAARAIAAADAWSYVAGLTAGQDLSERELQTAGPEPRQYNLGKSLPGFGPIGPELVTIDEFENPDDLEVISSLNGTPVQRGRTSDFIFSIPVLLEFLSSISELRPGDLIFTGTPAGTGWSRSPRLPIRDGDELVTYVEGVGEMRHTFRSTTTSLWRTFVKHAGDST